MEDGRWMEEMSNRSTHAYRRGASLLDLLCTAFTHLYNYFAGVSPFGRSIIQIGQLLMERLHLVLLLNLLEQRGR